MDELKINSLLMKKIISKTISKIVRKKFGCDINIKLDALNIKNVNETVVIHIEADGEIPTDSFAKIMKSINDD